MEFAIEILQHTTTAGSRWLVFLMILLMFGGIHFYRSWKKQRDELDSMKKVQMALEIKRLLLEIELIELELKYHSPGMVRIPRISLQEENEIKMPTASPFHVRWTDKVICGLLGSFFFLFLIILLYLAKNIEELQSNPYHYVSFTNELIIAMICGASVALLPGNKAWEFFFYGFILQVLLILLMVELSII